jgi:hypothetical protein
LHFFAQRPGIRGDLLPLQPGACGGLLASASELVAQTLLQPRKGGFEALLLCRGVDPSQTKEDRGGERRPEDRDGKSDHRECCY